MTKPMDKKAHRELKSLLAEGYSKRDADLEVMSYDGLGRAWWPEAVLSPITTEQVMAIVALANRHSFAVVPRGAGSGLTGGSWVMAGGVVLNLSRMNRILELDPGDMVARVEPGVITGDLQAAAEEIGLFYPPDPASRAFSSLGGNLAECSGGIRAVKYGVTRDYVLGLTAVTGGGELLKAGTRTIKGVVGYDLARLLIGSEGTLGIITEATLKLIPKPPAKATLIGLFPDVGQAARAVGEVFQAGVLPVAMEFLDDTIFSQVSHKLPLELGENDKAMLLAEVDGNPAAVIQEAATVAKTFKAIGGRVLEAADEAQAEELWAVRRAISPSLRLWKPNKIAEDVAVPRSKLPEMIRRLKEISTAPGIVIGAYGHAGDGNCHVNILFDTEAERPDAEKAVEGVIRLALELGGTMSGEHGVGTSKARFLDWELSSLQIDFMHRLKKLFDPNSILNPGKIFPPESGK